VSMDAPSHLDASYGNSAGSVVYVYAQFQFSKARTSSHQTSHGPSCDDVSWFHSTYSGRSRAVPLASEKPHSAVAVPNVASVCSTCVCVTRSLSDVYELSLNAVQYASVLSYGSVEYDMPSGTGK
jgi:hypothetical protein